ncbi:MAG: Hpt domain-containing protein [Sphingobium sp.]
MDAELIDRQDYERARLQLGASFQRILGYFREDGIRSVAAVEQAMRDRNAASLVIPAHTLKGESRQFGSRALGDLAERIEMGARQCVEHRTGPEELIGDVADLRACFERTLAELEYHAGPAALPRASTGFGRKTPALSLNGLTRS